MRICYNRNPRSVAGFGSCRTSINPSLLSISAALSTSPAPENMDFDDLDGPQNPPPRATDRPSRFAPNSAKGPLKAPKTEPPAGPKLNAPAPKPESVAAPEEELELKPSVSAAPASSKAEASTSNGVVDMDVDHKPEGAKLEPVEDESGEPEDEVVREIDVFFNPSTDAKTQLYVVQYPLRPWWRPYELDERCEEVRLKPLGAEVEVDLSIDDESQNYDSDCSNRLKMAKQTLASSWNPPRATSYAVGILRGNKLHLNPIHAMVQLRPSRKHLYHEESKMKKNVTGKQERGEEKAGPSEPMNKQETDEKEHWIPLKYHGARSDLSARYVKKMAAQQSSPISFAMSPYDYVNSLCPGVSTQDSKLEASSRRALLQLALDERIKKFLCEPPYAHRYSALRHYAPEVSDEEFMSVLEQKAILVQGLWVAKTALLFNDASESLARDCILYLFSQEAVIRRSVLKRLPKALSDSMKKFLNIFAVERPSLDDWKFKQPTDVLFLKNHPDTVKSQSQIWESKGKVIMEYMNKKKGSNVRDGNNTTNATIKQTKLQAPAKAPAKAASRTTMSTETREALPKALQKVFQTWKVCSFQLICERLRALAVSQSTLPKADARMAIHAANAVESPEELKELLNQFAVDIHGFYVLKSSPDHPEHDALRRVVIDLLMGKGPKAKLKKAEIMEAANIALKREVTKNEYEKVISDLCQSIGSYWVLKSGN